MIDLPSLSVGQFSLVYNMFSFTIASMSAAFVFFIIGQKLVAPKYRVSLMVSALVVGIAAYHYFRIFMSWEHAFTLDGDMYTASGQPFNDAYRYVDWLLTVPLLLVELILVLQLPREKTGGMLTKLVIAAAAMIALGYPGEIIRGDAALGLFNERGLWGTLSTIPFVYILAIMWGELGKLMDSQPPRVALLTKNIRLLMLATWGFYPIAYLAPMLGFFDGATGEVVLQTGYAISDVLAKAGFGVMIFSIARAKSEADGWSVEGA